MKNQVFTELYEEYRHLLMKIVFERSRNFDLAEEISQQAFVSFYEKMDTVAESFYKQWLILAAKNAVIDHIRKGYVKYELVSDLTEYESTDFHIITEDNVEMIIEKMANSQLSFRILEDLKVKNNGWYEVIEAICVLEMKRDEAAAHLQLESQALRAKLYRARKYIRKTYGTEYREF